MKNDKRLVVRVPQEMYDQLERIAAKNGVSIAELVRANLYGAIVSDISPDLMNKVTDLVKKEVENGLQI